MATKKVQFVIDVDGKAIDVAIDSTLNLKQQFRELNKELARTKEGTPEFEVLSRKIGDVRDQMDKTNAKSRDLFSSLSLLPGPVGAFAGSVDNAIGTLKTFTSFSFKDLKFQLGETINDFKDVASNLGKATGITKIYTVLNNALAKSFVAVGVGETAAATGARAFAAALTATGVGALVVALGFLISYLADLVTGEKAAKEASDKLNASLDKQKQIVDLTAEAIANRNRERIAQLKAQGATEQQIRDEGLRQQREGLALAQKNEQQARDNYIKFYDKASNEDKTRLAKDLDEKKKLTRTAQSNLTVAEFENQAAILADQKAAAQKSQQIAQQKQDKIEAANKQHYEKLQSDTKAGLDKLNDLLNENALLAISDARKREDEELAQQKKKEQEQIKALQLSGATVDNVLLTAEQLRQKLLDQVDEKYRGKQKERDNKRKEEDTKAEEDFNQRVAEIKEAAMAKDSERAVAERTRKKDKDLKDLEADKEFIKKSEEEKAKIRKDVTTAAERDIAKIKADAKLREQAIEKGDRDALFVRMMAGAQFDLDLRRKTLEDKKAADDKYYADQLAVEGLTTDQIRDINQQKLADQIAYTDQSNQLERDRVAVRQKVLDDIISIVGAESAVGRAALIAKQILMAKEMIMEIRRTITFSKLGLARSKAAVAEGTAQTAKVGFPQNIPLLIGYAAQAAAIISAVISATKSAESAGGGGGEGADTNPNSSANLGRNYEKGGMINGPRHAQGGVLINAEGGEAVMTRGAVTMFAPLLSAMNQMGGGTSFNSAVGQALPDAPAVSNPTLDQQPMIMKTYVVSNELTTEAERQARLKDLSTL